MAKPKKSKSNDVFINMELDSSFEIGVPKEQEDCFNADLKRSELNLSVDINVNGVSFSYNIYPDHVTNGVLEFKPKKDGLCTVTIKGIVSKEIYPDSDSELLDEINQSGSLPVVFTSLSDSECNDYYVDGDEDKQITIGKAVLKA